MKRHSLALAALVAAASVLQPIAPATAAPSETRRVFASTETVTNREVALRLAKMTIEGTRSRVILARDDVFADALAAGTLQGGQGDQGPLLLVPSSGRLPTDVAQEIKRLEPSVVTILGGTAAISTEIEQGVRSLGVEVERIAGADRFATAATIADRATSHEAFLARGTGQGNRAFADAIAIGGHAARHGMPVLLTATSSLPAVTRERLRSMSRVYVVGGPAAISAAVEDEVRALGVEVERVAGSDRAATAVALARRFGHAGPTDPSHIILTDGYADNAWAGGFAAAHRAAVRNAPILLAAPGALPESTRTFLAALDSTAITTRESSKPILTCAVGGDVCETARRALGNAATHAGDCEARNIQDGVSLYDRSAHWAIWWGGDAKGRDADLRVAVPRVLTDLEYAWRTAYVDNDMRLPPGAPRYCVNLYLHDTGGGVAEDIGGAYVSTDDEGFPHIRLGRNSVLPLADTQPAPNVETVKYTQHEAFHIFQYNGSGMPYALEHVWWIESTGEWFTRQQYPGDRGSFYNVAAWFLIPHMPLWVNGGVVPGGGAFHHTIGGHAYGGGYFLEYLTNEFADASLIYSAFDHTVQSGQRHLHDELERRGIDMADAYRDFAAKGATLHFPDAAALQAEIDNRLADRGPRPADDPRIDDRIAASHGAPQTDGFLRVEDRLRPAAWAYNTIRATVDTAQQVRVRFRGDATGTEGTPSEFRVKLVIKNGDQRTYHDVPLTDRTGDLSVAVPAGSEAYLVVASTPHLFRGVEQFGYQYALGS